MSLNVIFRPHTTIAFFALTCKNLAWQRLGLTTSTGTCSGWFKRMRRNHCMHLAMRSDCRAQRCREGSPECDARE